MSAEKFSRWERIQRMPVIRRVIRKAGHYACGICRQEFTTYDTAYQCLDGCWQEVQNLSPVVMKNVLGVGPVYRCRFCSRDYDTMNFARACASECKRKQAAAHGKEAQAINVPLQKKKRMTRLVPMRPAPQPRYKQKPPAERPETSVAEETAFNQPLSVVSASAPLTTTAITTPAPQDIEVKGRSKTSFKDQFYRNQAKYLCRFCNAEFFTKMEVVACFENHFDDNGYEKSA